MYKHDWARDSVSDSSKSATKHNNGTGKQKSTFGTTTETEKVKEHSQCQAKAQSTELVKQAKAKIQHTESGKQNTQSESVCEQDNADCRQQPKVINLIIQQLRVQTLL